MKGAIIAYCKMSERYANVIYSALHILDCYLKKVPRSFVCSHSGFLSIIFPLLHKWEVKPPAYMCMTETQFDFKAIGDLLFWEMFPHEVKQPWVN